MIRLRDLWIDGFGCLRTSSEPVRFDRERITLVLDDNEAGKTTLQMALLASLYGIEDDERRSRSVRPRKAHWAPAGGPPFGTRLSLHDGHRLLEVRWDFTRGNDFRVIDLDSNKVVTEELCPGADPAELGRRLLGVSVEEFLKTFLVQQDDLQRVVRDAEGLDALVQRAADTRDGGHNVASAVEAIEHLRHNYPGVMLKGPGLLENETRRLEEAIAEAEKRLSELDAERDTIAEQDAEYQRLTAEREELRREAARLDYLAHAAEFEERRQQIDGEQKRRAALAALEAEHASLAAVASFPADQAEHVMPWQAMRMSLLDNAEQTERVVAEVRSSSLEPARSELQALGPLATVSQEHVDAVQQLLGKTRDFEAREQRFRDEVAREEAQLADQGAAIEDLDRLEERFAHLQPDDGEFLIDHDRAAARSATEIEEARRVTLEATLAIERISAERRRQREVGHRLLVAGALAAVAALVCGGLLVLLHWAPAVAVGVLGLAAAAWVGVRGHKATLAAESFQRDQFASAQNALGDAENRVETLAAEQRAHQQRLAALAARCGYEQPDVLVEDYASLHDLRRLCGTLILLRSREDDLAAQRAEIEAEVAALYRAWGLEPPSGIPFSRALTGLQERMAASLRLRQRIGDLSRRVAEETERAAAFRRDAEALTGRLRALFQAAGIPEGESIEKAIDAFNQRAHQHRRFRQLTDELLPQARAGIVEEKLIDTWRAEAERLHRLVATLREERPGLLSLPVKERSLEYGRRRADAALREDALRVAAEEVGRTVLDTLARHHAERPRLEEALGERREQLARTRRHAAALELAGSTLEEIGREVHGLWAEEVNRSATGILQRLAPTLTDLKFDSRLSFGVTHRALPEPVRSTPVVPILSAGTWDQLCLAVRLCIADFVGRRTNGGLLLLDDPFAHFDDRRFEAAIRLLGELSRSRHQVVIFSCQRQRFQWLRERDKRWFDTNLSLRALSRFRPPAS